MIKTITLDGLTSVTVKESPFDMARFCWVRNRTEADVYISCTDPQCTPNADGVKCISAGECGMLDSESRETLYISGSGVVNIETTPFLVCPFNRGGKGGVSYELPIATTEILGGVIPDGTSITVDENGVISAVGSGETNYIIQYGVAVPQSYGNLYVTFPKTFATTPIVVVSAFNSSSTETIAYLRAVSKEGFTAHERIYSSGSFTSGDYDLYWIAIGEV